MLRLEYPIGMQTLTDVLDEWDPEGEFKNDLCCATRLDSMHGNSAIILTKTSKGDSLIHWFYTLKYSGHPMLKLTGIPYE